VRSIKIALKSLRGEEAAPGKKGTASSLGEEVALSLGVPRNAKKKKGEKGETGALLEWRKGSECQPKKQKDFRSPHCEKKTLRGGKGGRGERGGEKPPKKRGLRSLITISRKKKEERGKNLTEKKKNSWSKKKPIYKKENETG